jgi:hypothetical protein
MPDRASAIDKFSLRMIESQVGVRLRSCFYHEDDTFFAGMAQCNSSPLKDYGIVLLMGRPQFKMRI